MSNNEKDLSDLYRALGYAFRDESVIRNALTHSSYCYEHRLDYEKTTKDSSFSEMRYLTRSSQTNCTSG